MELRVIADIRTDFMTKFGVPRQSGLVDELEAAIVFREGFRAREALRGIEEYSHIWLIWGFSETERGAWSPTVRPPRLGGNERVGVFATRSPYRPNALGLSLVRLESVEYGEAGPMLHVRGADMANGTPIYDIKPYIPYTDCRPEAAGGFAERQRGYALRVDFPERLLNMLPHGKRAALIAALSQDPRPAYQSDPRRVYGFGFAGFDIRFRVSGETLTVCEVVPLGE